MYIPVSALRPPRTQIAHDNLLRCPLDWRVAKEWLFFYCRRFWFAVYLLSWLEMDHLPPDNNMPSKAATQPTVFVILGPTASGKSELALALAKKTGAEIISADSRQIYRELNIGAAKPPPEALREVTHHFVNEKNIGEPFTAGDFALEAGERIHDIHRQGKRAIVAGGSTLYLEGLLEGFADLPPADPAIRKRLLEELEREGGALSTAAAERS